MSQQNKELAYYYYTQVWNEHNRAAIDEVIAPDIVDHSLPPGMPSGIAGTHAFVATFQGAFPDVWLEVELQVAEGDLVVTRWRSGGTHRGELLGIPASGRTIQISGISIDRVQNGMIVESWTEFDMFTLMQQIGAIPAQ